MKTGVLHEEITPVCTAKEKVTVSVPTDIGSVAGVEEQKYMTLTHLFRHRIGRSGRPRKKVLC